MSEGPPPPPSALPQLEKIKFESSGASAPSGNPFAPRTATGISSPPTSILPPPPSALPPPMSFPKPGAGLASGRPRDIDEIMGRSKKSPSPNPAPPVATVSAVPQPKAEPKKIEIEPIRVSPSPPSTAIPPANVSTLSPIAVPPQNPPPQIEATVDREHSHSRSKSPATREPTITSVQPQQQQPVPTQQPKQATQPQPTTQTADGEGMFDWLTKQVHENPFLSMVAEKAKVGMETVLTTLDPGMKDFLSGDGIIEAHVGTEDPMISSAVRQGFEKVFHSAVLRGVPVPKGDSPPISDSVESASAVCEAQMVRLSASRLASPLSPFVVFQPFILPIQQRFWNSSISLNQRSSRNFYSLRVMLRWKGIDLFALSQPIELPEEAWTNLQKSRVPGGGFGVSLEQLQRQMTDTPRILPFAESDLLIHPSALLAHQLQLVLKKSAAQLGNVAK